MSSFLSAAENVARQCQTVLHDLKKMGWTTTQGWLNWRLTVIISLFLTRVAQGKRFCYSKKILFNFFCVIMTVYRLIV